MATHSSTLAWKLPWMEEPGRLQSIGSRRVGQDWVTSLSLFTFMHWRRKWHPTPAFLPGESQGRRSLVGCRLRGRTESDMTKVTQQQQDSLRDLWDNIKWPNIWIIGVPEKEDKMKRYEKIFEKIIVKSFPKMGKEIATQVQEDQRIPHRINPRRNMPRHILIKWTKIKHKEQILKAASENNK